MNLTAYPRQLLLAVVFGLGALLASPGYAQETGKIHFLTFQLTNGVLVLAKSAVVPGTLKPDPAAAPLSGLRVALEKGTNATDWSRLVPDPSVVRLEYEDPDHPGAIKFKTATVENTAFVVRAPFYKEARQVAVFREEPASPVKAANSGTNAPTIAQVLLLRAPLTEETK